MMDPNIKEEPFEVNAPCVDPFYVKNELIHQEERPAPSCGIDEESEFPASAFAVKTPIKAEPIDILGDGATEYHEGHDTNECISSCSESNNGDILTSLTPQSTRTNLGRKRKRTEPAKLEEVLGSNPKDDEFTAYSVTVAAKLRGMDNDQRCFAENVINAALFMGFMKQLTPSAYVMPSRPRNQENLEPSSMSYFKEMLDFKEGLDIYNRKLAGFHHDNEVNQEPLSQSYFKEMLDIYIRKLSGFRHDF